MYDEIKDFFKGRDQNFEEELVKINNQDLQMLEQDYAQTEEDLGQFRIIDKYRQTDAYKRLLKRQGLAVKRIERIKESFEKKRRQVTMLAVHRDSQKITGGGGEIIGEDREDFDNIEARQENSRQSIVSSQPKNGLAWESSSLNYSSNQARQSQPLGSSYGDKSFLSSQTPLSFQVILEERSSIQTQNNQQNGKVSPSLSQKRNDFRNIKKLQVVEPYMKTCQQYFQKLNKKVYSSTANRKKSMENYKDLSQFYQSSSNISYSPNSTHNRLNQSEGSNLTGMHTYQNEIIRNKSPNRPEQKAFYQPSILRNSINFSQRRTNASNSRGKMGQTEGRGNYLLSRNSKNRPQTTANDLNIKLDTRHNGLIPLDSKNGIPNSMDSQVISNSYRAFSNEDVRSSKNRNSKQKTKPQQLPKIQQLKEHLQPNFSNSQQRIQEEVKEQDEEWEESRLQSQKQTISQKNQESQDAPQMSSMNINIIESPQQESRHNSESRLAKASTFTKREELMKELIMRNETSKNSYGSRGKQKSAVQSYNIMKNQIMQNIKSKQYWPSDIKHPDEYRAFYWTPDMSACGFSSSIKQSAEFQAVAFLKERKAKHSLKNSIFRKFNQSGDK